MPSLGALGAIGGAAKGFESFLTEDLKNQRAMKLEELKTTNRRETNKIDAEMRNEMAMGRESTRAANQLSLEELRSQNQLSLEETRQGAPTSNMQDLQALQELGVEDAVDRVYRPPSSYNSSGAPNPYAKIDVASEPVLDERGEPKINMITGEPIERTTGFNVLGKDGSAQFIELPQPIDVPSYVVEVMVNPPEGANIEEMTQQFINEYGEDALNTIYANTPNQ
jgi:hypothetical protein